MTDRTGCGRDPRRQPLCWRNASKPNGQKYSMCAACIERIEAKEGSQ